MLVLLFANTIVLAQNQLTMNSQYENTGEDITTPPEIKVESITSNPRKRKASVVKDGISLKGIRYVWGANRLCSVALFGEKSKLLLVSLMATRDEYQTQFYLVLTAERFDIPYRGEIHSPVLIKYKDDTVFETVNVYDSPIRKTNIGLTGVRYDVTNLAPIGEEQILSLQKGLSKFRLRLDSSNFDIILSTDNISEFLIDEYKLIIEKLETTLDTTDDF